MLTRLFRHGSVPKSFWASRTPDPQLKACGWHITLETDHERYTDKEQIGDDTVIRLARPLTFS
jgi:hypothetical protein